MEVSRDLSKVWWGLKLASAELEVGQSRVSSFCHDDNFREMSKNVGQKTLTDDEDDDDGNMTGPQSPLLS